MTALALSPNNAGAKNVGAGDASQFITGGCIDDSDCSSACCADLSGVGICSAYVQSASYFMMRAPFKDFL